MCIEYAKFIRIEAQLHQAYVFLNDFAIVVEMLANNWQDIEGVSNFVHLVVEIVLFLIKLMPECDIVLVDELEHGAVVRHDHLSVVGVSGWPRIEVKMLIENLGIQNLSNFDAFVHYLREVVNEQERGHEVVLILGDVPHDFGNGSHLVVSKRDI